MTLATRCPACGTVFRVVQDQLRVSQGWVRCGRCSEAFNALEAMVDWPATPAADGMPDTLGPSVEPSHDRPIEPETTVSASQAPTFDERAASGSIVAAPVAAAEATYIDVPPGVQVIASDGAMSADLARPLNEAAEVLHDPVLPSTAEAAVALAEAPVPPAADAPATANAVVVDLPSGARVGVEQGALLDGPDQPPPSFVLQADRAERWRRPGVRLALSATAVLAVLGLAAQYTYAFRDRIAATYPAWRPALQQACATLGCRVGDYRQIDALSVESTGLLRVEGAPIYRLAVTLRNRGAVEVAAPAIDLSLTDAQGRQIARRVLQMSDLNLPLRTLKPGSELPIQAPLSIGDRQVSGYSVEIFYP